MTKKAVFTTLVLAFALVLVSRTESAATDDNSLSVAAAVKLYIAKDHKKRGSDPKVDFEKLHKICGKQNTWTKGCRFWKTTGGNDKFQFQVRPKGKIYGIPSLFIK